MNATSPRAGLGVYVGLALTTMTTLAYQLLLTRIFSVTMFYHYSFMAISVTMFGMTVGAIGVYLLPKWFTPKNTVQWMGATAASYAGLIVASYLIHLQWPFDPDFDWEDSWAPLWLMVFNYVVLTLPFTASGICVTLALTRFPGQVGKLYAVDLVGAGVGCLFVALVSHWVAAPVMIVDTAALAMLGAMCLLANGDRKQLPSLGIGVLMLAVVLGWLHATPSGRQTRIFHPRWVKGEIEEQYLYEKWNSHSRVAAKSAGEEPIGWGLSPRLEWQAPIHQKWLHIDASAGTVLTHFDGDMRPLEYLRYDVTNVGHAIRSGGKVLAVGAGGGRDVLSALCFQHHEVVGVEINEAILDAVNREFGEFTGHLDQRPDVRFVHDEARSYLAKTDERFDVVQISLIDTWAAVSAGAFVLSENSLYTIEAWDLLLRRLNESGVLSVSRWHAEETPTEVYRLVSLAAASLRQRGIQRPADHMLLVYCPPQEKPGAPPSGIATLLVSNEPFSEGDIGTIERLTDEMEFEMLVSPRFAADETLATLTSGEDLTTFLATYPADITPPTDDRPFFFDMLRLGDVLTFTHPKDRALEANMMAIVTLGTLLATVVVLTGLCVIVPLLLTVRRNVLRGSPPFLLYFAGIGFGFMLVEIGMMQRLNVFLGHPIYSMTVVLFSLLVASGLGSWLSSLFVRDPLVGWRGPACLIMLCVAVPLIGIFASSNLLPLTSMDTPGRIGVALALLLPLGLTMGTAFPLGMRTAGAVAEPLTPWLFGVNGATSICGSVLAVVISLCLGISAAMWLGLMSYGLALLAYFVSRRRAAA